MIVDSSALVAILLNEPDADRLAQALAAADTLAISAPSWLEAMMAVTARLGPAGTKALEDLIQACGIVVEPADLALTRAAFVAWQRFGKDRHRAGLNFGDCFSYALARRSDSRLLFKGDDFALTDLPAAI